MLRRVVLVLLLTFLPRTGAAEAVLPPEVERGITRAVEQELRETAAPGAAVAIVRAGEIVYLRAFGVRSLDERTPVTPDTLFRLGSTTKMMTALAVLDAAAKGRLSLDAPLRTYAADLDPTLQKLTLRQLLTHTAGMAEAAPSVDSRDDAGLGRMVLGWKADSLFAPPGEVFSYSGPGYWLAGFVLERVHGKPYADVMQEELFLPLGMERTTLRPLVAVTRDFAQGHEGADAELEVVRPMAENTAMYPAGSVFSSVRELAHLATALVGQRRVFDEPTVRQLFSAETPLPGGEGVRYGFGLVSYKIGDATLFEHGGVRRGYGSHLRFLPERRGAVVLLTNRNGVTLTRSLDHITKSVFGLTELPESEPASAPLTAPEAQRYTGTYAHTDLVRYEVRWDGSRLVLRTDAELPLRRMGVDTFWTPEGQPLTFVFRPGETRARYLHMDLLTTVRTRDDADGGP